MDQPQDNTTVDLNRSLPSLPLNLCLDLPPNISFNPTSEAVKRHERLTSSTSSTSASSGKQQFQNLTRDLLHSSDTESPSPTCDPPDHFDPVKYNPSDRSPESPTMPSATQSYHELSDLNPFRDSHDSSFEDVNPECGSSRAHDSMEVKPLRFFPKPKGMSQSRSESHINYRPPPPSICSYYQHEARDEFKYQMDFKGNVHSPPLPSPFRGRSIRRTPSPTKPPASGKIPSPSHLDDIKEDQPTGLPVSPTKPSHSPVKQLSGDHGLLVSPTKPSHSPVKQLSGDHDLLVSPIKRSRSPMKQLFGEHGWLGKSTSMKELPSEQYRKTGIKHWGGKLKQRVGEMTEDVTKKLHPVLSPPLPRSPPSTTEPTKSNSPSNLPPKARFPVSLSPPEQSRFFAELELMICATANEYLQTQQHFRRMSPSSVAKVAQTWVAKNRPQVMEFLYDQQTQRDLVLYNLKTFRFYGPNAENAVALNSMMLAWKQLGKDMSVRTFCTPDSVIRKQLHDSNKVLEMLGAPMATFIAFQRLSLQALQLINDRQAAREEYGHIQWGVEKAWEPSPEKMLPEEKNPFS